MPRIAAGSVAEHRAQVRERLVDAAERMLRAEPDAPLTAGEVASAAGIARNSIYRYVDSVDDLHALVVDRYLPGWVAAVHDALEGRDAADRVVAWVRANLEQTSTVGHRWLMGGARGASSDAVEAIGRRAHQGILDPLVQAWRELLADDPARVGVAVDLTVGLLDAALRRAEAPGHPVGAEDGTGSDPAASDLVVAMTTDAARALTGALGVRAEG